MASDPSEAGDDLRLLICADGGKAMADALNRLSVESGITC